LHKSQPLNVRQPADRRSLFGSMQLDNFNKLTASSWSLMMFVWQLTTLSEISM